jgi:hypothetical protein
MSGASALAAAKRRRAVPTEPSRPSMTHKSPEIQRTVTPVQVPSPTPAQSPLHLLIQHEQKLKDLEHDFTQIKLNESNSKSNALTPETLLFFKTQHDLMNQEINDLKKLMIKIQSFSMETNLELLKLKKQLKVNESNETTENIA